MRPLIRFFIASAVGLTLSACKKGSSFDFLDSGSGDPECTITTHFPSSTTVKASGVSGTTIDFSVGTSADTCAVSYTLNGGAISSTNGALSVDSVNLNAGNNTLVAATDKGSFTWTVYKNTAPICGSQTPAVTGTSMAPGGTLLLTGAASDLDSDALNFSWQVNNAGVATSILSSISNSTQSQATFTPTTAFLGSNIVSLIVSDGTDTTLCNWSVGVSGSCAISSTSPSAPSTVRVAYSAGTTNLFQATTTAGCGVSWTLNSSPIGGATSASLVVDSNDLQVGANILSVAVTNGTSTDSRTWTVVRNTPPSCGGQVPAPTGGTVGVGGSMALQATASDLNGDSLTFSWKDNGATVATPQFTISSGGANVSNAVFVPDSSNIGVNVIRADISDSYDVSNCTWNVTVVPVCAVASSTPSGATFKMGHAAATSQSFVATSNDASCTLSWRLNGAPIVGTSAIQTITSSQLSSFPLSNTLEAVISNGYTTATRTWTVARNDPPLCGSQTPAATGNNVGVGGTITFDGTATNNDSDTLQFSWLYNGSAANPLYFATGATGNTASAIFNPNASFVGNGQTLGLNITDGYDSAICSWNVNVLNSCAIASAFPSSTTYKIAYNPATSTTFGVIPSDGSCAQSWSLNGAAQGTGPLLSLTSSDFSDGPATNTLSVVLDNGITAPTTRTWTVTKNRVPVCSSKSPSANPPAQAYTSTLGLTISAGDPDGDTLSNYSWKFNGATSGTLFTPVNTGTGTSNTVLHPTLAQVGTSQAVSCSFDDGYDSGSCSWAMDIMNPNTVDVLSCNPVGNPVVVYSTGVSSTQTLSVVAVNASAFQWYQNGTPLGSETSASLTVSAGSLVAGNYSYRGLASDGIGNSDYCDFNIKVNAKPSISSISPSGGQTYRLNYTSDLAFSVSATDGNADTLTYVWTLDGVTVPTLPSGAASTTFSPGSDPALIGSHNVTVTVSDGYESDSRSWTVEVNYFSNICNTMYNGSVATQGGKICTLVGIPTMGNGMVPSSDQTQVRVRPAYVTDDGAGNWFFSDQQNNTVNFWNRSTSTVTIVGKVASPGTMVVVAGNGANGITVDNVYNTNFKLDLPMGVAYDSLAQRLYIADYNSSRVVALDSTGLATTVLGPNNGSFQGNANPYNNDATLGTSLSCGNPAGLVITNTGGNRWLYVACAAGSHNVIKRMDIDPVSANYLKAWVYVGRVSGGAVQSGPVDGAVGASGDASVMQPWGLAADSSGNIYWTDYGSLRLRVATASGSPVTFFGGLPSATSAAFQLSALDTAAAWTSGSLTIQAMTISSAVANLGITGPNRIATSGCSYFTAQLRTGALAAASVATPSTITVTGAGGTGGFYSDAACSTPIAAGVMTIPASYPAVGFYYKNTAPSTTTFTISNGAVTTGTYAITITNAIAGGAARTRVVGPPTFQYDECLRLTVQVVDASNNPATSAGARTFRISNNGIGSFYSASNCSGSPLGQITIAAGVIEQPVYFATNTVVPANWVGTLAGNSNVNGVTPTGIPSAVRGMATLRQPRGVAVISGGGSVKGIFVSHLDQHRITYYNNSGATTIMGGTTIAPGEAGLVVGTGTGAFNADGVGNLSRLWTPYGIHMLPGAITLAIADYDNYRVRSFEAESADGLGEITTHIGVGRARFGNLGDSPTPATSMYLNTPGQLVVDDSRRKIYVSDSGNARIRRIDLLSGLVDTIIGKGTGAATTDDEDPTNVFMTAPRGLVLASPSGNPFLIYADQAANTSANQNCLIRAFNMTPSIGSPPPATILGSSINANRISTIAGDYLLGCQAWTTAPINTFGGAARSQKLYNPEGIAYDGNNLLIAVYNDHCIVKLSPAGTITPVIGTCGSVGVSDGSTSTALVRYPTAIAVDPLYASDGNFFFADVVDQSPSRVRYVNYRTGASGAVTIGSTPVPAATAPNGIVQTIWTISPSGNSAGRIFGLAAFGPQLCIAGGLPGNGNNGSHNVTCYDRSNPLGSVTLRVGANEATSPPYRAGAPLDLTQEGGPATSGTVYSPYGIAFDSSGNLYISERSNHIIRMVRRWW